MKAFDSHAHLDPEFFGDDLEDVVSRAFEAGLVGVVTVGSGADPSVMQRAVALASSHPRIWAAVGIHPHEADRADDQAYRVLEDLAGRNGVVAVGEAGLDFHYELSSRDGQVRCFTRQIRLACHAGKPLVIHCRDAHDECLDILSHSRLPDPPGVIHCFTGDIVTAARYVDMGFMISIPGVVTFSNAGVLKRTVERLDPGRMLVETDSPYLAPHPRRGRRNEPAYVLHTIRAVAAARGEDADLVASVTAANASRLFGVTLD